MSQKTCSKISVNITDNGLDLFILSPEVGESLSEGRFLESLWKKSVASDNFTIPFDFFVKYFATPKSRRKPEKINEVFSYKNYIDLFKIIFDSCGRKEKQQFSNITIDPTLKWLFQKDTINIHPLTDPGIKNGKTFSYQGVFSTKIINENVLPVFKFYIEGYIKTFVAK